MVRQSLAVPTFPLVAHAKKNQCPDLQYFLPLFFWSFPSDLVSASGLDEINFIMLL
jgi:hypothetical protein